MKEQEPRIPPVIEIINELQHASDEEFKKIVEFIMLFIQQEEHRRFGESQK